MSEFQKWWEANKEGVCFDVCQHLKLDLSDPKIEARLMHLVSQGWVAAQCEK